MIVCLLEILGNSERVAIARCKRQSIGARSCELLDGAWYASGTLLSCVRGDSDTRNVSLKTNALAFRETVGLREYLWLGRVPVEEPQAQGDKGTRLIHRSGADV